MINCIPTEQFMNTLIDFASFNEHWSSGLEAALQIQAFLF